MKLINYDVNIKHALKELYMTLESDFLLSSIKTKDESRLELEVDIDIETNKGSTA